MIIVITNLSFLYQLEKVEHFQEYQKKNNNKNTLFSSFW